jgi:hypothetical protein
MEVLSIATFSTPFDFKYATKERIELVVVVNSFTGE